MRIIRKFGFCDRVVVKQTSIFLSTLTAVLMFSSTSVFAALPKMPQTQTIADALGWESDHSSKESLCRGHYTVPADIYNHPNPPPYNTTAISITAKGPVIFRANGVSILQDDVEIQQPGRLVTADKAILFHDKATGKVTKIELIGHVHIQESGKLLVGKRAVYNISKNTITLNHAIYHITGKHELVSVSTPFDAWGTASTIDRKANGVIDLKHVSYSTCAPIDPSWTISANSMQLDREKGEGTARGVIIHFKKVPIFYAPYYSFPLNSARKSGLLTPAAGYSTENGFFFAQPYYWNIAPNYDLLLTPEWYSYHGTQLNADFRYLTGQSDGFLYASFLPNDRKFAQFQQSTLNSFAGTTPSAALQPYVNALATGNSDRAFIDFENHVTFNQFWTGKFYARYLSDPYYAESFQSQFLTQNTNQIPSFAELNYTGSHWNDTFLMQAYQTLHPIDQFLTPAQNQYTRLPEIDFNAAYPRFFSNFNFNLSGQLVHFDYSSDYAPLTYQVPIGERVHIQPSISRPFTWSALYLTPQLTADSTNYFSELPSTTPTAMRPTFNENRTLPIFDLDSGLYLDRSVHIGGTHYIQTIEPRLFYLYTPYVNQNNDPNFDTQLLPFSVSNLYAINQFSGFDRIQNANQLTVGLSSRLLRSSNSDNVLTGQMGFINYFSNPRVCLVQGCTIVSQPISPITGALNWNPNPLWSFGTQTAWDTALHQVNNAQVGVQYHTDDEHVVVFGYQFTHGNPDTPFDAYGFSTNASLLTMGLTFPLALRWQLIGYTYYDLTHKRPENQYLGLSYNTCCWALRFIVSDNFTGTGQINGGQRFVDQYSTSYYIEFLLKGLGSTGNHRAEDMLMSTLPGFEDIFSNRGHYGYSPAV